MLAMLSTLLALVKLQPAATTLARRPVKRCWSVMCKGASEEPPTPRDGNCQKGDYILRLIDDPDFNAQGASSSQIYGLSYDFHTLK
jgi:hypothetical protein